MPMIALLRVVAGAMLTVFRRTLTLMAGPVVVAGAGPVGPVDLLILRPVTID